MSEKSELKSEILRQLKSLPRLLEITLALLFILAAYLKAIDPNLFVAQIYGYGVIHDTAMLRFIAIFATAIEAALGVAMLVGLRLGKLTHITTMLMLLFYTGLIAYAWQLNGLKDCGCFGDLKIPPQMGIVKNIIMMAALAYTMRGKLQGWSLDFMIAKITLTLLVGVGSAFYIAPQLSKSTPIDPPQTDVADPQNSTTLPAPTIPTDPSTTVPPLTPTPPPVNAPEPRFANIKDKDPITGEELDLAKGEYIVAVLSMTCDHCMATVPIMNDIAFDPNLPPVIALCWEPEEGDLANFVAQTRPEFAMHSLGKDFINFAQYIGSAAPRVSYLRDGHELFFLDGDAITMDAIYLKVDELRAGAASLTSTPPTEKPAN